MSSSKNLSNQPDIVKRPDSSPLPISDSQFDALVDLLGIDSDTEDADENEGKKQQQQPQKQPNIIVNPFDFAENPDRNQKQDRQSALQVDDAKPRVDAAFNHVEPDLIDLANNSPLWNHVSIQEPLQESTPLKQMKTPQRSPDLASIRAALDLAQREAEELKERCRSLEALLRSRSRGLGVDLRREDKIQIQDQRVSTDNTPENDHVDPGDVEQQTALDNISLPQARLLLKFLLRTFSLSVADVQTEAEARRAAHVITAPATSSGSKLTLDDIRRSVEFVSYVDELVWRRSRLGCKYEETHGEDNISALKERIDLWERVIRSRPLKPIGREDRGLTHP